MCVNYLLKTIYFIYILNILLSIYFFYIIYCLEYINLSTIIDNKVNSWPLIHGCLLDVFALKTKKRKKKEDWVSILEVFDTYGYDTH